MMCYKPGDHGSTFGGNPLASVVARAALSVVRDEKLPEKALKIGEILSGHLNEIKSENKKFIKDVRGKGLLQAIEIKKGAKRTAWDLCLLLKSRGFLAKPTHEDKIRFAPPLIITEEQMSEAVKILRSSIKDIQKMETKDIPGYVEDVSHKGEKSEDKGESDPMKKPSELTSASVVVDEISS